MFARVLIIGLVLGTITGATLPFADRRKKDPSVYLLYNSERRSERPEHVAIDTPEIVQPAMKGVDVTKAHMPGAATL